jgi:hypothetical protein
MITDSHMPAPGVEVHPWMPRNLHGHDDFATTDRITPSPLGDVCKAMGFSIHDRHLVHAEMKRVEQKMLFGEAVK